MTLDADQIIDRRRLRRKLTFWRVAGFLAVAIIIVGGIVLAAGPDGLPGLREAQIARVTISGFITEDQDQIDLLERLAKTDAVKGVIVAIDSTGGATSGGEALYEGLLKLSKAKPTVASIGTFGASAAYMAAIATDHVIVRRTSITGSIGVVFQFPEVSQLMKTLGIAVEEVKSSPLKAEPSPFKPATEEARQVMAGIVRDSYDWFVDIVARRRDLPRATALALADGRIFTGRQALRAKLVDEIGGEETAIAWLATKGVDRSLPIRDWQPRNRDRGFFSFADAAALWLARQTGIAPDLLRGGVIDRILPQSLKLDGLMSVWQGPLGRDDGPAEGAGR
jgi:protease-4